MKVAALKLDNEQLMNSIKSIESNEKDSIGNLQRDMAILEAEKSKTLRANNELKEALDRLNAEMKEVTAQKEKSHQDVQDREEKLSALTQEVERLRLEFTSHIADLEGKLKDNDRAAEVEQQLRESL